MIINGILTYCLVTVFSPGIEDPSLVVTGTGGLFHVLGTESGMLCLSHLDARGYKGFLSLCKSSTTGERLEAGLVLL